MLISLNAIKQYVNLPADLSTTELLDLIGSRLVEIEEVHDLAPKYDGIYVVKVISAEDIPGTHLHLCQIDAGADPVQVVCGAPNVHAGMLTAWITPGSIVPATFGNENFRLSVRKLQGYDSNGMLAAADELDLGTDHAGIVEIDPKLSVTIDGETRSVRPGDRFADAFDLNDVIIDVENKSLTHRPDCFGLIGFAREVSGILDLSFTEPPFASAPTASAATAVAAAFQAGAGPNHASKTRDEESATASATAVPQLAVKTDVALCPRYSCAVFDLGDNTPSKYLTKEAVFLAKAGMRSIDPMVDLTNLIMLETGQPLHAFDYDKLVAVGGTKTPKIIVRAAKPGEQLQLLDGKTIECIPEDILITSNDIPVALAGAMGGKNTEIDASTKRVVLESATFSLFHLRKTQMAHGIFSEAITRFTKGQPAAMTLPVLLEALRRLDKCDNNVMITDTGMDTDQKDVLTISVSAINNLLGTDYDLATITKTLENVGFTVKAKADQLAVTAPAWRTDIHIAEDVIEEVGRLLGFDNITLTLPSKPFSGTAVSPMWQFKQDLRHYLSGALRMHELITYSFISTALLEKVGQNPDDSYAITNSISPELQRFRQHIAPSLLDKVRENQKSGHTGFTLYELNQVSSKSLGLTPEGTPSLEHHLGIVSLGDFYQLKSSLAALFRHCRYDFTIARLDAQTAPLYPYLEPAKSAILTANGQLLGAFGEVKSAVLRRFKLDGTISAAELRLDRLLDLPRTLERSLKLSKFPFVERDLTLKVPTAEDYARFAAAISDALAAEQLIATVTPLSIYQPAADAPTKNLSFRLKFASPSSTLASEQISAIMEHITSEVSKLGAELV